MQENRSFDHTYGTLKGVRGYSNPRAITLPNNYPVWLQTNKKGHTYAPFRLNIKDTKATWMSALPHSWENQVAAANDGKHDGWLDAKRSGLRVSVEGHPWFKRHYAGHAERLTESFTDPLMGNV